MSSTATAFDEAHDQMQAQVARITLEAEQRWAEAEAAANAEADARRRLDDAHAVCLSKKLAFLRARSKTDALALSAGEADEADAALEVDQGSMEIGAWHSRARVPRPRWHPAP